MKAVRTTIILLLTLALSLPVFARGGRSGGGHRASHSTRSHTSSYSHSHASRKSHTSGSHDGHYQGGHGSSHKGGHYKSNKTGDHYRDRKHGTPQ